MGHAGLSSLLVVLLPLLLTSLHPTIAARLPGFGSDIDPPFGRPTLDEIIDTICNLPFPLDTETASIIKAELRESPGVFPSEVAMKDDRILTYLFEKFCENPTNITSNTTTDSTTVSTTDSTTVSTTDSTTVSTTDSTLTELSTTSSSSETPPLEGLELYTKTQDELSQITIILDNFTALVNEELEAAHVESVASARRVWGGRDLPVAWWQRRKSSRPRADMNFCLDDSNSNCNALETELEAIDELVVQLTGNVDAWEDSDLTDLTYQREQLQATYQAAKGDDTFLQSVDNAKFTEAVGAVQDNVASGSSAVQGKIAELSKETDSGSIALVATLGSVGGLMVMSLIGVAIYGAVQKSKTKKKLSSAKPKREDIPIDAYAHDAPGSRPPPKMNPYSPDPVPAPRNYHHPGQFDPRREPVYPESINGRPQQGLRRTNY